MNRTIELKNTDAALVVTNETLSFNFPREDILDSLDSENKELFENNQLLLHAIYYAMGKNEGVISQLLEEYVNEVLVSANELKYN